MQKVNRKVQTGVWEKKETEREREKKGWFGSEDSTPLWWRCCGCGLELSLEEGCSNPLQFLGKNGPYVFSSAGELPETLVMATSHSGLSLVLQFWAVHLCKLVGDFKHHWQMHCFVVLLKVQPVELLQHLIHTRCAMVLGEDKPCSLPLYCFNVDVLLGGGIQDCTGIFQEHST